MRTVGVEEELLLIDGRTGAPVPVAGRLLARAAAAGDAGPLTGELHREMLEVITRPHRSLAALDEEVTANRALADRLARGFGARAAALATSPTAAVPHPTDDPRYRAMIERYGSLPRRVLSCGLHVHVAVSSPEEGVAVLDRIRTWTPVLLAMTVNSPFHDGVDTGHASWRSVSWSQWPSSGPMELYGSAARYRSVVDTLLGTGTLLDPGMLYFDARLSHRHPTIEIRVADVPLDAGTTATVAGLARALVDTAAEEWRNGGTAPQASVCALRLANWCAALGGLGGTLVDPTTGLPAPAAEVVAMLLAKVLPALVANGDDQLVERGAADVFRSGTGAARQRAFHAATADVAAVALAASDVTIGAAPDVSRVTTGATAPAVGA
ncbi:glutamate--cysteine ligase [Curtobacterium sp. MCSS17_007]|uniref:glutamate--cysteine ligase n=1 Tax=Curtobacterium sp. MCSS17_007 TaxID=2175646 RepID=UPI000DA6FA16|nr:glutamate--cysteine ligase [Curtobacterium sp. MCSS17_007]WIE74911.1 glutamate--cysteine ligase [Curtobacterium sp. MCSS17_007]